MPSIYTVYSKLSFIGKGKCYGLQVYGKVGHAVGSTEEADTQ